MKALLVLLLMYSTIPTDSIHQQDEQEDKPIVKTEHGFVSGVGMTTGSGRKYFAFPKIPYAKPPLGKLRFQRAEAPEAWSGVLDTVEDVPHCWQIPVYDYLRKNETFGTEDCLYLSVFSPNVSSTSKLPVMVFIHGGGWRSELPYNGPPSRASYLMDHDILLVLFNYRLGPLGFMSTEDEVLPGNLGLKDQAEVIRWISGNIANFGGDPDKITLFGNSAGGASTHYHLISPETKHLLQGGISQSGTGTCLWAFNAPGVTARRTQKIAEHLGCPTDTSRNLVDCLETKSAQDITAAERLFISQDFVPTIAFPPIIERGENAFVPASPFDVPVEKPWIVGMASEDGAFKLAGQRASPDILKEFLNSGSQLLPEIIMYTNTSTQPDEISSKILDRFVTQHKDNIQNSLIELWTDSLFTYGVHEALKKTRNNAYFYVYSHRHKTTWLDLQARISGHDNSDLGASHTDELYSLFNYNDFMAEQDRSDVDRDVSKQLVKIWVDFAKYGYPKSVEDWKPYSDDRQYLNISEHSKVQSNLWPERVAFWQSLPLIDKLTSSTTQDT